MNSDSPTPDAHARFPSALDQQGRGPREQLPEGSGLVLGAVFGLAVWALVAVVFRAMLAAGGGL